MVYPITKRVIFPLLKMFVKDINGFENLPEKGPFILVSREKSLLDTPLMIILLLDHIDQKVHTFASRRFWNLFGDRIAGDWAGCIPIDKDDKTRCLRTGASLLRKGEVLLMYPTGHPNKRKPKTGISRLHLMSKAPIIPFKIKGTDKILPYGKSVIPRFKKKAVVSIGKPFSFDKYYGEHITKPLLENIARQIMKRLDAL